MRRPRRRRRARHRRRRARRRRRCGHRNAPGGRRRRRCRRPRGLRAAARPDRNAGPLPGRRAPDPRAGVGDGQAAGRHDRHGDEGGAPDAAGAPVRRGGDDGGARVPLRTGPLRRQARLGRDHVHAAVPSPRAPAGARRARRTEGPRPHRRAARAPRRARHATPARGRDRHGGRGRPGLLDRIRRQRALSLAAAARPRARVGLRVGAQRLRAAGDAGGPARAGGGLPGRARTLQPQRDRRRRPAAARRGLAHHAARRRDPESAGHVRRSVPRDPDAARRVVGRVAAALSDRARLEPQRDRLPAGRHAHPAAVPSPVRAQRRSPRAHRRDPVFPRRRAGAVRRLRGRHRRRPHAARAPGRAPRRHRRQPAAGGRVRPRAGCAAGRDGDGGRALRLPGVPARPRDRPGLALVLGLPAAARRRHPGQRLDGLSLRRRRRAGHPGAHGDGERSQPAARAVADPRLSPPRSSPSPDAGAARGDVPGRARLRPHVQQRHRLLGLDGRASDRCDVGPEHPRAGQRRRERHDPRPAPGRGGAVRGESVLRAHVVAGDGLRGVVVPGDDLAADARRCWCGPACAPTSTRTRRRPSPRSIPA